MRKKVYRNHCSGEHTWGTFIISVKDKLIKECKYCPAILTKEEYLLTHKDKPLRPVITRIKVSHVDLFQF